MLLVERLQWTLVLDRDDVTAFLATNDDNNNTTASTMNSTNNSVWTMEQQDTWINVTQEWFDEFYNGGFAEIGAQDSNATSRRDRRRLADNVNYGVVPGSMTCTIELLESHIIHDDGDNETTTATLMLLYNQQLNYRAFNNSDQTTTTTTTNAMGPLQYTTLPFRSRTARPVYVQRLTSNELMAPLWQSLTVETLPVPQILGPKRKPADTSANSASATDKADDPKKDNGWSIGAIAGVVVAGLAAVMVGAAVVLYVSQRDDGRHDNVASLVPDFERATFSFGGGSAANGGGGGVRSGRLATDDQAGATDLEASSDEVPKPRYVLACVRNERHCPTKTRQYSLLLTLRLVFVLFTLLSVVSITVLKRRKPRRVRPTNTSCTLPPDDWALCWTAPIRKGPLSM
jgi:hypothetical protein